MGAVVAAVGCTVMAQELIYQEGFNTDGSVANPIRYTFTGHGVYEVPAIQTQFSNYDQKGPIYWAHNFETSKLDSGNPEIPARRMIWTWRSPAADGVSEATEDLLKLWDSSVAWLLNGKANARVVVQPNAAAIGILADRLTAAGHTVVDDDLTGIPDEQDVVGDLFIHGPAAGNASRFVMLAKPVIVMNEPDYDDMLVGSIGSAATFTPGEVKITAPGHPAAGGKTGSFSGFTGDHVFALSGKFLAQGATILATVDRSVAPAVTSLADLDAIIAGTQTHEETAGTVTAIDFNDGSAGTWGWDNAIPGSYTGNWGLRVKGKMTVATAGTYRFALGSDDGAKLLIDTDKNGFTVSDTVVEDFGPHAHQAVYGNVTFAAAGTYDFEVRSYNSGGGGSLELSVAVQEGEIPDDTLDSGYWEALGADGAISPVKLEGTADVTAFIATGPNVNVPLPLAILMNGPTDVPAGHFFDGGGFTRFEGNGFIGAAGLNKFGAYPDGQTYRSLILQPVNVSGKTNVKVTVSLAATGGDFEDTDYLQIWVHTNGVASPAIQVAYFGGVQNAVQPWLADRLDHNVRRLTHEFTDFTYNVPAESTQLVVEFRAATTWWTEIVAFDNVRITSG
ncbi:MAG TPA: PA14 domain-containing protein, partial [Verrucomicrobiae bacterium]|nr:PA14 domain-containing protein [Verrucomicrobiae bacterium]